MNRQKKFEKSQKLFLEASKLIPLASQTFSKSHLQYPKHAPLFISQAQGAKIWDIDGNEFIDLVNGLLSVILGYADPDVDSAIVKQLKKGVNFSLATDLEYQLADRLVKLIPCAEMVRFGKNGSDVTTAAIRLARAYTGRDKVAVCGYHGWHDWFIGSTTMNKGVPHSVSNLTYRFEYNNILSLEKLLEQYHGQFAAVIMEPINKEFPKDNFLQSVKMLCSRHQVVFILDEIITGFRCHLGGAQSLFNVTPDLATFGKSMGNGMPISALVGRLDIMKLCEKIFFSSTFGGEALSLAAAIASIDKMIAVDIPENLSKKGSYLAKEVSNLISKHLLSEIFNLSGIDSWKILTISNAIDKKITKEKIKYLFMSEMIKAGILIQGSHNISFAHTVIDLEQVIQAYDVALGVVSKALNHNGVDSVFDLGEINPVFCIR